MPKNDIMKENELNKLYGKEISVFVRYGFKKKVDEIQSYQGKLISVDKIGIMLERKTLDPEDIIVYDFFPWHNIDAIRYRIKNWKYIHKKILNQII